MLSGVEDLGFYSNHDGYSSSCIIVWSCALESTEKVLIIRLVGSMELHTYATLRRAR